jgi:hypothetical protein
MDKGLIGSGLVLSTPAARPHRDPDRAKRGERAPHVNIRFDVLAKEPIICLAELTRFASAPAVMLEKKWISYLRDR